ncbi:transcriptional regulator, XRE family [Desulfonatronospira thiodismutans ASO3-1]|uniref:Transcriptional regulator, XRE family n=1 Tax=Desulfonatronospira thiodismutans ASO3-1 TaxID=555779 RepID=D6SUX2_9BACT|nr:helix-turn-helix domain-containing protein [Desulfonatronospira thiodismutans]EFI32728.1 transcriptional regulator, XRE family [Desulfonatronospira thiodismutans ASO3-1]
MITPAQIRAARGLLRWSQKDLSKKSGVSLRAVNRVESEECDPRMSTLKALEYTLEQAGVVFINEEHKVGVYLRSTGQLF